MVVFVFSCNEDLYVLKPNYLAEEGRITPMPDSVNTLLALTPMTGPNADTLKALKGFVDFQFTSNLRQELPDGIDVVYVNADYAVGNDEIGHSDLIWTALGNKKSKILIDGSKENIEKYCKSYMPVQFPNAEMVAYYSEEADSTEKNEDAPEEARNHLFSTMVYGKEDNEISVDMLRESLWDFSPELNTDFEESPNKIVPSTSSIDNPIVLNPAKNSATMNANFQNLTTGTKDDWWPDRWDRAGDGTGCWIGTEPKCGEINGKYEFSWNNIKPLPGVNSHMLLVNGEQNKNDCAKFKLNTAQGVGCHVHNYPFVKRSTILHLYNCGNAVPCMSTYELNTCNENAGKTQIKIQWGRPALDKVGPVYKTTIFKSGYYRFDKKTCKSCYIDMAMAKGKSRSWGQSISTGNDFKYSGSLVMGILTVKVGKEVSKAAGNSSSQSVSITKVTQREFWVSACMFSVAGGTIYGRGYVETKHRWTSGKYEVDFSVPYKHRENLGYVTYCMREDAPANAAVKTRGFVRTTNQNIWSVKWYNRHEIPIKNFNKCKG